MAEMKKIPFLDVTEKGKVLTFALADGQILTFNIEGVNAEVRERAMIHGFNQKIRDASAGFSKDKDYDGAFEAMQKVIEALEGGSWNRTGGAGLKGQGVLAEAIARMKGVDITIAGNAVKVATDEQKKGWMKNPKVAALMAQIVAERAQARLDAAGEGDEEEIEIDL